ncbi:type I polyketide synthase [Saccharospirillum salsuginis]|uniref:Polyketide synthase n=1 Tax=Saccharospirillum salsuginis TaxID=418750 RepID=A0A918NG22_9GAMM|nr:type I polyketide synthase [Saccharospirillum salsuginis]GGX67908.1 polyketide synthase [Saccharospirillum salsuginis]
MTFKVAIIGMACRFPGASDTETFWRNIRSGVDAVSDYPMRERWGQPDAFYDPAHGPAMDRTYCRRGGVVSGLTFNPMEYGIVPREVEEADAEQFVMLDLAREALAEAGVDHHSRGRAPLDTGVIIGRTLSFGPVVLRFIDRLKMLPQIETMLRTHCPSLKESELNRFSEQFLAERGAGFEHSQARNLVPGFTAARIANRLNLRGPNYILDAACASSLIALESAIQQLEQGSCDMMLAGGIHLPISHTFWSLFSSMGALSQRETITPFDQGADGLLLGEGAGLVLLKPLETALADGNRIHAVIEGVGSCSDGRAESLLAPYSYGQVKAIENAWRKTDLDPARLDYLECHGTGMPRGDEVESQSIRSFYGEHLKGRDTPMGSVKSMIGHTLGAAGIAGVIKTACALRDGVVPPSLHCERVREDLAEARFHVPGQARPWSGNGPRLAGVSAFGFGGINGHAVLSEAPQARTRGATVGGTAVGGWRPSPASRETLLALARPDVDALLDALDRGDRDPGSGPCRLVVIDPTPERVAKARRLVVRGKACQGRQDIFFSPHGVLQEGGQVAFLFPGLGDQVNPEFRALADRIGLDLSHLERDADTDLIRQSVDSVLSSYTLCRALETFGVRADAMVGHSLGEWISCVASGLIDEDTPVALTREFAGLSDRFMGRGYHLLAVWCGADDLHDRLADIDDLHIAVDNCPRHTVLCGSRSALDQAEARLQADGVLAFDLGIEAASHSPFIRESLSLIRPVVDKVTVHSPRVQLWSSSLAAPFPKTTEAVRDTLYETMARPVRFRDVIEAMYQDGVRAFVQMGNAGLTGFVNDTLAGRPGLTLDAAGRDKSPEQMLRRIAAGLFVEGRAVELEAVGFVTEAPGTDTVTPPRGVTVSLDPALVEKTRLPEPPLPAPGVAATTRPPAAESGAYAEALHRSLARFQHSQQAVLSAYSATPAQAGSAPTPDARAPEPKPEPVAAPAPEPEVLYRETLAIDHDRYPELFDHEIYKAPPGAGIAERSAVVPMTMMIELACDVIQRAVPERVVIAVDKVLSFRFVTVTEPLRLEARVYRKGEHRYSVVVGDHFSCVVDTADTWPDAPRVQAEDWTIDREVPATNPIPFERVYHDRWLFHGPKYQGLIEAPRLGERGALGRTIAAGGKGALLDGAFQMSGLWFYSFHKDNNVVLPLKIERVELFASFAELQASREPYDCRMSVDRIGDNEFVYSVELARQGRVMLRAHQFNGRRFEMKHSLQDVFRSPERRGTLCQQPAPDVFVFRFDYQTNWSRVWLTNNFLGLEEQQRVESAKTIHRRNALLMGSIVAKDAVKDWLFQRYPALETLFPRELHIEHDDKGAPRVVSPLEKHPIEVSISRKPSLAAAIVGGDTKVGIDLETIETRGDEFERMTFDAIETAFFDTKPASERPFWQTLFWTAKEAFGKYRGTGLAGAPKRISVRAVYAEGDGWTGQVAGRIFHSRQLDEDTVLTWVR